MPRKGGRRACEICGMRESHSGAPVFFASFPLDKNRCREWVRVTGNEDLLNLPIKKLNHLKHICGDHFDKNDFSKSGKRLKKEAVPVINLFKNPLSAEKMSGFPLPLFSQTGKRQDYGTVNETSIAESSSTPLSVPLADITRHDDNQKQSKSMVIESSLPKEHHEDLNHACTSSDMIEMGSSLKRKHTDNDESSPKMKRLIEKLKKTKRTLNSLRRSAISIDKIESPLLKELILNACNNEKKKPTGRRWTTKHKQSCLALMISSPKTYKFLSDAVPLPCIKTLQNILKKVPMQPEINQSVLIDHSLLSEP